ncbi:uncharacterized protein LOC128506653 isoform X2 [Clarias gariepinus]|nr:uncharacterized protein LOC128506653 isoform X2 [Clarias gariepinus]
MMSDVTRCIKEEITSVLPSLPKNTLHLLVEKVLNKGVETKEDLQYVKEKDVAELIRPIQCRKLLKAWSAHGTEICSAPQSSVCSLPLPSSSSSSSLSSPLCLPSPTLKKNWPATFAIPWDKMPPGITAAADSGKRLSPADRRQMVCVLVDEMRKFEANPMKSQCLIIAERVVRQFPQSFANMIEDRIIGGGYSSLLTQIKVRVEHLNRNNTLARLRSNKCSTGAKQKTGPADSYGCTQWQPDFPPEVTETTLDMKKQSHGVLLM